MGNMFGTARLKAKEPGAPAIDAIKEKALHALNYAARAAVPEPPPADKGVRIPGENGEVMDLWWDPTSKELVVAFSAPDSVLTHAAGSMSQQPKCLATIRQLKMEEGEIQVAPNLTQVLDDFLTADAFQRVRQACGDAVPRRIICTGIGVGGSIAAVAAVVLAVQYIHAHVRCVTVDSPIITYGSPAFATLYRLLVSFSYHINTDALLDLVPDLESFPLYGQYTKSTGMTAAEQGGSKKLSKKPFQSTTGSPANWDEKFIRSLVADIEATPDTNLRKGTVRSKEDEALISQNAETDEEKANMRQAADAGSITPEAMKQVLGDLYAKDPTGKDISLKWTDENLQSPFTKMDSVEKMLLVGSKCPALAGMAAAAYEDGEEFRKLTGVDNSIFVNRNGKGQGEGQAHVVWRPEINTLIVAFRGTAGMTDVLVDLKTTKNAVDYLETVVKGAKAHKGFYNQLIDMWPDIMTATKELLTLSGPNQTIDHVITTGHSLGGALATLGGPAFAKAYPRADVSVISFAAPRAGNEQFKLAFGSLVGTSMRFQYNYDAVPCVPMWYLGFQHVDVVAYLKPSVSKDWVDEGAVLELLADTPHSPGQCFANVGNQVVANHNMGGRYIGALVGYMQRLVDQERAAARAS